MTSGNASLLARFGCPKRAFYFLRTPDASITLSMNTLSEADSPLRAVDAI
jgi:hypothetical protein